MLTQFSVGGIVIEFNVTTGFALMRINFGLTVLCVSLTKLLKPINLEYINPYILFYIIIQNPSPFLSDIDVDLRNMLVYNLSRQFLEVFGILFGIGGNVKFCRVQRQQLVQGRSRSIISDSIYLCYSLKRAILVYKYRIRISETTPRIIMKFSCVWFWER